MAKQMTRDQLFEENAILQVQLEEANRKLRVISDEVKKAEKEKASMRQCFNAMKASISAYIATFPKEQLVDDSGIWKENPEYREHSQYFKMIGHLDFILDRVYDHHGNYRDRDPNDLFGVRR